MTKKKPAEKKKPSPSCKDCGAPIKAKDGTGSGRVRKPGPRCATCWDIECKRRKEARHERDMAAEFGLEPGDYDRLLEAQGGACYLCGRKSRHRLPVDHDHRMPCAGVEHPAERGCRKCVRGLVDDPCNEYIGRVAHDDPEVFARGYWYLTDPPARKILTPAPTTITQIAIKGVTPADIVSFDEITRDWERDMADHLSDGHGGPF